MNSPIPALELDSLSPAARRVVEFFENLKPADIAALDTLYNPKAHFRDPFNDVRGIDAIAHIFRDMFEKLRDPRFVIDNVVESPNRQIFVTWYFHYGLGKRDCSAHGGSLVVFDEHDMILAHHDYWDAASGVYENIPVIGALMRWLRARVAA